MRIPSRSPKSRPVSPFPHKLPNGKIIIDEVCQCGALRSDHNDTLAFGHGGLEAFSCQKYTFKNFVFKRNLSLGRHADAS